MRIKRLWDVIVKHSDLSKFLPFIYLVREGEGFGLDVRGGVVMFNIPRGRDGYEEFMNFLHLLGHILLCHHQRGDLFGKNELWDTACDLSVSNFIYKDVIMKLPAAVRGKFLRYLKPFEKDFLDLSTEEIYILLSKGEKLPRANDSHSSFTDTPSSIHTEIQKLYVQQKVSSSFPGNQPGNYTKRFNLYWTKIPPKFINAVYMKYAETLVEDFPTPDIPSLGLGRVIYLSPVIPYPHFVFLVDCSDSMSTGNWIETSVSAVWTISNFLVNTFPTGKITVILADTRVTNMWTGWSNLSDLKEVLSLVKGFGGTDIISSFFSVKDTIKPFPFCVCIFSDYEFDARVNYPIDEVLSYFRRVPLYIAVTPANTTVNTFYYNLYLKESRGSSSYVWTVDALKLFKEKLPHLKVRFNEF